MTTTLHDYLILGAGPSGLQMAYFLQKAGYDYIVLEAAEQAGSFFATFPRHGRLISINKVYTGQRDPEYNLRHDWNSLLSDDPAMLFKEYSTEYFPPATAMTAYLVDYARHFALNIQYDTRVVGITKDQRTGHFHLHDAAGRQYACQRLLVATGVAKPYLPAIPGIELAKGYEEMSVNPKDYQNQSVLIIGKGNAAFETAENLMASASIIHLMSPHPLRFAWNSHYVGHVRSVNTTFIDSDHLKSQNVTIDAQILWIAPTPGGKLAVRFAPIHADEIEQIEYDHVLRCTGFQCDSSLFDSACAPALTIHDRFPALTSAWESVNVPNMYFLGALMQSRDFHQAQSGFIHGFRHNMRSLLHILEHRYHGRSMPCAELEPTPEVLAAYMLRRMNSVSSLWQQSGFLCDVLVMPTQAGEKARYYPNCPESYVHEYGWEMWADSRYYVVRFQYGPTPDNVFDHARPTHLDQADQGSTIHPTIDHYHGATLVETFHVMEDLMTDWSRPEYVASVQAFFSSSLRGEPRSTISMSGTRYIIREGDLVLA